MVNGDVPPEATEAEAPPTKNLHATAYALHYNRDPDNLKSHDLTFTEAVNLADMSRNCLQVVLCKLSFSRVLTCGVAHKSL